MDRLRFWFLKRNRKKHILIDLEKKYWKIIEWRFLNRIVMSLINSAWLSMKKEENYGSNYNVTRHHSLIRNTVIIACLLFMLLSTLSSWWWWNVWLMKVFYIAGSLKRVALAISEMTTSVNVCVCGKDQSIAEKHRYQKPHNELLFIPWSLINWMLMRYFC